MTQPNCAIKESTMLTMPIVRASPMVKMVVPLLVVGQPAGSGIEKACHESKPNPGPRFALVMTMSNCASTKATQAHAYARVYTYTHIPHPPACGTLDDSQKKKLALLRNRSIMSALAGSFEPSMCSRQDGSSILYRVQSNSP